MNRHALAALAVALTLPLPARAGLVLQYEDQEKQVTTVELEGKKLRSLPQGGHHGRASVIFDGDRHVFYSVDDEKKTYQRMDEASGAEMATGLKDAMEQAKAKMTPEQRAQMEAFLSQQGTQSGKAASKEHAWKFERAPGGEKVAGHACDKYRVLRDGKLHSEACFVPWGGAFRKDDFQAFQEMGRFLEKTFGAVSESQGHGRKSLSDDWVTRFVETAPGFPAVMDRVGENGERTREMRLVKIERASLAAGRFAPPADYREKKLMKMHGGDDD